MIEKVVLYNLYIVQEKPMRVIAGELNVSISTVFNYCEKYGIATRNKKDTFTFKGRKLSEERKQQISKLHKGKTVSAETRKKISESSKSGGIGHKKIRPDGYVTVYFPDHPKSTKDGHIMEHVLVMECLIGRHLHENECVHHINEVKSDNRKENLKLMTKSEHMSFHMKERHKNRRQLA